MVREVALTRMRGSWGKVNGDVLEGSAVHLRPCTHFARLPAFGSLGACEWFERDFSRLRELSGEPLTCTLMVQRSRLGEEASGG